MIIEPDIKKIYIRNGEWGSWKGVSSDKAKGKPLNATELLGGSAETLGFFLLG